MAKIFNFSTLPAERIAHIKTTAHGCYTFDFTGATVDRLDRLSTGYTREALALFVGRYIVTESFHDGNTYRQKPVIEQFNDDERATLEACENASFNYSALRNAFAAVRDNMLFRLYKAICLDCGEVWTTAPTAHDCGEVECAVCGAILRTDKERAHFMCKACATARLAEIYRYHHRPNKARPRFEREDERATRLHLGAEIEVDGGNRVEEFTTANTREFSALFNGDPFNAFIEFETDGSLRNGVECITAPTTFEGFWKRRNAFNAFYEKAREMGGTFDKRNGLHFHIDRDFLGVDEEERGKALVLLELMVYKFFNFFAGISRRETGHFGYTKKKDGIKGLYSAFTSASWQDHSYAVNASGCATVEIRFFGGHIATGDDFLACADIVQALAKWAKASTLANAERATPCDLVKYLRKPDNVAKFIDGAIDERPKHRDGEEMIKEFKKALSTRIARANGEV